MRMLPCVGVGNGVRNKHIGLMPGRRVGGTMEGGGHTVHYMETGTCPKSTAGRREVKVLSTDLVHRGLCVCVCVSSQNGQAVSQLFRLSEPRSSTQIQRMNDSICSRSGWWRSALI